LVDHKIPFCPPEHALCPALALHAYVKLYKGLKLASYINHESSIWLGITAGREGLDKCFLTLSTPDPIAKDTLGVMTAAGIDGVYKAHAMRSAVASSHINAVPLELDLMTFARWSSTSVFRNFYARMKAKQFSIADITPATVQEASPLTPPYLHMPPPEVPAVLVPRLNILGPKGDRKTIPGTQVARVGGGEGTDPLSSCWEPDDHTMVWCGCCNRHFHAVHLEGSAEEVKLNHSAGWFCSNAKCVR
jgi:hypothetical protein